MPSSDTSPTSLPALLDLTRADALQATLQQVLAQDSSICLDGSLVERVGTACLQLLVAAALAARARGRDFTLRAPSPALGDAIRDLGLAGALGLSGALGLEAA